MNVFENDKYIEDVAFIANTLLPWEKLRDHPTNCVNLLKGAK